RVERQLAVDPGVMMGEGVRGVVDDGGSDIRVSGLLPPFIYLFPVSCRGSRANHGDNQGMADRHLLESADSPIPSNSACCCLRRYSTLLSPVEPDLPIAPRLLQLPPTVLG